MHLKIIKKKKKKKTILNTCTIFSNYKIVLGSPQGVVAKVLDCGLEVNEFKLKSGSYVHFQTNTLGKGMNLLNQIVSLLFFYKAEFGTK